MSTLVSTTRADLFRLRRWPAFWVIVTAWLLLNALFSYVFDFVTYTSGDSSFSNQGQTRAELIATIVPSGVADTLPQGMPLFGGAIMMVLGAIAAGNGYGWGTWKTVFTQGPTRARTVLGSMSAVAVLVAALLVTTLVVDLAMALGIAGLESQPVTWPAASDLLQSLGGGLLVMEMWAMAGYFLGTVARSPAVSVGLGVIWAIVIEQLLRGVGNSLHAVAVFTHFLPGTAAGSLIGRIVDVNADPDPTPGLFETLTTTRALITVLVWLVVLPLASLWLVRRRDVA
jgi:ABC-type transport system involved in multi-copper enzyme maturation permease subunit